MPKYANNIDRLQPKVNPIHQGIVAGIEGGFKKYEEAQLMKQLDDPKLSPIKKAAILSKYSPQVAAQYAKHALGKEQVAAMQQNDANIIAGLTGGVVEQPRARVNNISELTQRFQQPVQAQEVPLPGGLGLTGKQYAPVAQMQQPEVAQQVQQQKPRDIYDYAMKAPMEEVLQARSNIQNEDLKKNLDKIIEHRQKVARDEAKIRAAEVASGATAERAIRKETLPLREQYANEAKAAAEIKANQQELMSLVETGNLDDPKLNILAKIIPHEAMKQFLSPETVTYEAIRAANFAEVRNMFKGTTNLKEIEIEDARLASTYLNDMQKKAIIRQRIKAEDAKLLRSEAAAEVEQKHPFIGPVTFQQKVEKLVKPRLEKLAKEYADETKKILGMRPLSPMNEQDRAVIRKYVEKANGNRDLAKKKLLEDGYRLE